MFALDGPCHRSDGAENGFLSEITGLEQGGEVSHGCEAVYARHGDLTHLMRGG